MLTFPWPPPSRKLTTSIPVDSKSKKCLSSSAAVGSPHTKTSLSPAPPASGKPTSLVPSATKHAARVIRSTTPAPLASLVISTKPKPTALIRGFSKNWQKPMSSSSMTSAIPRLNPSNAAICAKSSKIATLKAPPSSPVSLTPLSGTPSSATKPSPMRSAIASCTTLTVSNSTESPYEKSTASTTLQSNNPKKSNALQPLAFSRCFGSSPLENSSYKPFCEVPFGTKNPLFHKTAAKKKSGRASRAISLGLRPKGGDPS